MELCSKKGTSWNGNFLAQFDFEICKTIKKQDANMEKNGKKQKKSQQKCNSWKNCAWCVVIERTRSMLANQSVKLKL
jgi:hypothetical protein